jgi:DNA polymerase III epsilon subunit-like protein
MFVVCTLDIESTGLSPDDHEITEIAYVIKEWGAKKPLIIEHAYCLTTGKLTPEITELTGITDYLLSQAGMPVKDIVGSLCLDLYKHGVTHILAQNGVGFDRKFLVKVMPDSILSAIPWIDSKADIQWPASFKSNSLKFLACELGFLNPFPHDALSDVFTTIKVVELAEKAGICTFAGMVEYSQIPWAYVVSNASFDQKDAAKAMGYRWESIDEFRHPKAWVNKFKENELEVAQQKAMEAGFKIRKG